jgi:hypothetical protein
MQRICAWRHGGNLEPRLHALGLACLDLIQGAVVTADGVVLGHIHALIQLRDCDEPTLKPGADLVDGLLRTVDGLPTAQGEQAGGAGVALALKPNCFSILLKFTRYERLSTAL